MPIPGAKLPDLVEGVRERYGLGVPSPFWHDLSAHPRLLRLISHARGLAAALEPIAESPISCADKQCHRGMCGPEECGRCSRAIAAWRALRGEFD